MLKHLPNTGDIHATVENTGAEPSCIALKGHINDLVLGLSEITASDSTFTAPVREGRGLVNRR